MKKVVAVVGPTASGKTSLSIFLAKHLDGEIVGADSMQIYKDMPIATATPTLDEQQGVPHHLVGFLSPESSFSVADYVELAKEKIDDIILRNKTPIVVGGTGLFINSLFQNLSFVDSGKDESYRKELFDFASKNGNIALHEMLINVDMIAAEKIHPNNLNRVVRALELFHSTGTTISEQVEKSKKKPSELQPLYIGITFKDREALYHRINNRVDLMIENGLVEEAQKMLLLHKDGTACQAIGHKEMSRYLKNEETLEAATDRLKMETRRYAKRQLTWFRRNESIHWLFSDIEKVEEKAIKLADKFMKGELE